MTNSTKANERVPNERIEVIAKGDVLGDDFLYLTFDEAESMAKELRQRRAADKNYFLYGIAEPDGSAYVDEVCVSHDQGKLEVIADELNRDSGTDGYSVVALYTALPLTDSERTELEEYRTASKLTGNDVVDQVCLAAAEIHNRGNGITDDKAQFIIDRIRGYLEASKLSAAAVDVMSERQRQINAEGWTPESDDEYVSGEMAGAAACYAHHVNARGWVFKNRPDDYQSEIESSDWPWSPEWWKPTSPRRDLVKAGALIIAEIERIDRAAGGNVEVSD